MTRKQQATEKAKHDVDRAKRDLMRIYYELLDKGSKVEADKLDRIIARLEAWQHG